MTIKSIIVYPGLPVFFSRNNEKVPTECPHCLSKNIQFTLVEENILFKGWGYKLKCDDCFAEIIYKEEKDLK